MVKLKKTTSFVCQECGYDSPAFLGKCPECGNWNTFKEIQISNLKSQISNALDSLQINARPKSLGEITTEMTKRTSSGFSELDTVFGGGIVAGSASLLAGDPGIGKSTLLLQICLSLAKRGQKVLYISGEESVEQIKLRALRLGQDNSSDANIFLLGTTNIDQAVSQIESLRPSLVVLDSVQTMQSENVQGLPGAIGQVRYTALQLIKCAKAFSIPVILIGHVTKEGMVAGPMLLSHMVDCVLFLEGEKSSQTRLLRSFKNRFGPVDEVGIFAMEEKGMREVVNPEALFLSGSDLKVPGSVLVSIMEGTRAFLVEVQALTVFSKLPLPRRVVSGVDGRRVELLLAILQKHAKLPVETMDVFVNVAGGLRLSDPAADLGICLAIASSIKNKALSGTVGIAEVGLLGELRTVPLLEKRIKEAKKLGLSHVLTATKGKMLLPALKEAGLL